MICKINNFFAMINNIKKYKYLYIIIYYFIVFCFYNKLASKEKNSIEGVDITNYNVLFLFSIIPIVILLFNLYSFIVDKVKNKEKMNIFNKILAIVVVTIAILFPVIMTIKYYIKEQMVDLINYIGKDLSYMQGFIPFKLLDSSINNNFYEYFAYFILNNIYFVINNFINKVSIFSNLFYPVITVVLFIITAYLLENSKTILSFIKKNKIIDFTIFFTITLLSFFYSSYYYHSVKTKHMIIDKQYLIKSIFFSENLYFSKNKFSVKYLELDNIFDSDISGSVTLNFKKNNIVGHERALSSRFLVSYMNFSEYEFSTRGFYATYDDNIYCLLKNNSILKNPSNAILIINASQNIDKNFKVSYSDSRYVFGSETYEDSGVFYLEIKYADNLYKYENIVLSLDKNNIQFKTPQGEKTPVILKCNKTQYSLYFNDK